MISVADLLVDNRVPGNYFASDAYVHSDLEMGLLENRQGQRLLALPQTLLQAIHSGLDKETGQASGLVLMNCGRWWGKSFYARFNEELSDYYQQALADLPMIDFLQCLQQCWKTHGWGRLEVDLQDQSTGFLIIRIWNSPYIAYAPRNNQPAGFLERGVLSAFFSQLTGRDLACIQTSCESMGADCNRFVLGLPKRFEPVRSLIEGGQSSHDEVMTILRQ